MGRGIIRHLSLSLSFSWHQVMLDLIEKPSISNDITCRKQKRGKSELITSNCILIRFETNPQNPHLSTTSNLNPLPNPPGLTIAQALKTRPLQQDHFPKQEST